MLLAVLALLRCAAGVAISASRLEACATDGDDGLTDCEARVSTFFSLAEAESTGVVDISAASDGQTSVAVAPVRFQCRQLGTSVVARYTTFVTQLFASHDERMGTSPPAPGECWLPSSAYSAVACTCSSGLERSGNSCGLATLGLRVHHCLSVNAGLDPAAAVQVFAGADVAYEWAIGCDVTLPWSGGELPAISPEGHWDAVAPGATEATAHVVLRHNATAARVGSLFYARCVASQVRGYEAAIALLRSRYLLLPVRQPGAADAIFAEPAAHAVVVPEALYSASGTEPGRLGQSPRLFYEQPGFCRAPAGTAVPGSAYRVIRESVAREQLSLSAPFLLRRALGDVECDAQLDPARGVTAVFRPALSHEAQLVVQVAGDAARITQTQCSGRILGARLSRALDSGSTEPATLRVVVGAGCREGFRSAFQVALAAGSCVAVVGSAAPRTCEASCAGDGVDLDGALPDCLCVVAFPLATTCAVAAGAEGESSVRLTLLALTDAAELDRADVRVAYRTDVTAADAVRGHDEPLPTTGSECYAACSDLGCLLSACLGLQLPALCLGGLFLALLAVVLVVACIRRHRTKAAGRALLQSLSASARSSRLV